MTPAEEAVRRTIAARGPIGFDELVEQALYHPDGGFYATAGQAGRRGDFLTAPEVGPLFGAVVARALDGWWTAAGRPASFTVVEAGAGPGTLARSIQRAAPACAGALRHVLVERSAAQRSQHPTGPGVVSTPQLPDLDGPCIVLANELLDNLPFGVQERTRAGWADVCVGLDGTDLVEVLVPTDADPAVAAAPGARVPVQAAARAWVAQARALAGPGGRVVAFDYATTTRACAARPWQEWVRTYRAHSRGGPPLEGIGTQDITCEVATDQLPPPASDVSQADWLRARGLDELVDAARRAWQQRAAVGDLEAMRARSRVHEGDALVDPAGLGGFRVLEWLGEVPGGG